MPLHGEYAPGTSDWAREQAEAFEANDGVLPEAQDGPGIVLITSVGATTGKLRKTMVMRVEHEGEYAAVASKGGSPDNPGWYFNLKKNPHVELQDGPVKKDYLAREVDGDEYQLWWERALAVLPNYADFQQQTDRQIPVFVLSEMPVE